MAAIWTTIAVAVLLAILLSYGALRATGRHAGPTLTIGLFMLAAVLGIIAVASVTFFRKTAGVG